MVFAHVHKVGRHKSEIIMNIALNKIAKEKKKKEKKSSRPMRQDVDIAERNKG